MRQRLLLLLVLLLLPFAVRGYAVSTDSLEQQLPRVTGIQRVDLLNQLSEAYKVKVPAEALTYGEEALQLARKMQYNAGITAALGNVGEYYLNNGNYDQAIQHFEEALRMGQSMRDTRGIATALTKIGVVHYYKGEYDQALQYNLKAMPLLKQLNFKKEQADNLSVISYIYNYKGNSQKALFYSLQALRLRQELEDNNEIAKSLNSIGDFYLKQNNLAKALLNYRQSLSISRKIDNKRGIAFSMSNIGTVFVRYGQFEQALRYHQTALYINRELGNQHQIAASLVNIGTDYSGLARFEEARESFEEALGLFGRLQNRQYCSTVLNQIGRTYSRQKNFSEAMRYHRQALSIAEEHDAAPLRRDAYKEMADTYLAMQNAPSFMQYYQKYVALRDTLESRDNKIKIAEMQAQFEEEDNRKELEKVTAEKQMQAAELRRQKTIRNYLLASIVLSVGFSGVLFSFYRLKTRSNQQLQQQHAIISQQNEELNQANIQLNSLNERLRNSESELIKSNETKDKFFSIIAHDLRSPLATFTAFLSVLSGKNHTFTAEQITEIAIGTEKSLRNLSALLNNLLQWSQSQMGHIRYDPEAVWLYEAVQQTVSLLTEEANNKQIQVNYNINHDLFVYADRNMLAFVLRNLLYNAIKFTPKAGCIQVRCTVQSNEILRVTIADSGVGISPENLQKLFKLNSSFTTRGTSDERGTGLGLLLCKEFVEKNKGEIWVESKENEGSQFHFTLPLYKS